MFFSLNKVAEHPLYQLQPVIRQFFEQCSTAERLDWKIFPLWFQNFVNKYKPTKKRFEKVFKIISSYPPEKKRQVLEIFNLTNNIEELCNNKNLIPSYIEDTVKNLKAIKELFEKLFDETFIKRNLFEDNKDDSINNHYLLFRELNKVCPFCGIEKYADIGTSPRDSYDHYLSEKDYFLAGVNFNNLVPMCFRCNSGGNKGQKDVLYKKEGAREIRRAVYYPYSNISGVRIEIDYVQGSEVESIEKFNITLIPNDENDLEKVNTWNDVFNITSRLSARIKDQQKNWIKDFIAIRFPDACNEEELREAARFRAAQLADEIHIKSEAVLQHAFFNFIATTEHDYLITGYCDIAQYIAKKSAEIRKNVYRNQPL